MSLPNPTVTFNQSYFQSGCGEIPYERRDEWLQHFARIADMLTRGINPGSVLDAGCAMGFLVEALRDRGIDAFGVDVSDYAISQVREDIRPYCAIGSVTDPLPQRYDLIVCIEVLEHLPPAASIEALAMLCNATNDIIFSSSPEDYTEATHLNVQPPEYWAGLFAGHGFWRDVDFDGITISPWAARFRKSREPVQRIVMNYERKLWPLTKQVGVVRELLLQKNELLSRKELGFIEQTRQAAQAAEDQEHEIQRLNIQQQLLQTEIDQLQAERERQASEYQQLAAKITSYEQIAAALTRERDRLSQELSTVTASSQQQRREVELLAIDRQNLLQRMSGIESRLSWQLLAKAWHLQMRVAPPKSRQGRAWMSLTRLARGKLMPELVAPAPSHDGPTRQLTPAIAAPGDNADLALAYNSYQGWALRCEEIRYDSKRVRCEIARFTYTPTVSIVMPTYNSPERYLKAAIDSVLNQYYPHWELCICDDASPQSHVRDILTAYADRDDRIKVVFAETNSGIGGASNQAIALASGEYVGLLDHDDLLTPDALSEVVTALQSVRADLIYSDEDKLDENLRRCDPFLKPSWSPDLLLSCMYTGHFSVYRRELVEEIGGFRTSVHGSQDYDLALRFTERARIVTHIPKILYHWRKIPGSAAAHVDAKPYAYLAAQQALIDALARRGIQGSVERGNAPGYYHVHRAMIAPGKVSIIIPTRDRLKLLRQCIASIETKTTYIDYEIIIVDNGSREAATRDYLKRSPHRVIRDEGDFNYSRLNNLGARAASGDYLLLLNNDTEVIAPDWLSALVEEAQRPEVGAVGGKLLYPDGRIQHAGVLLGLGGVASHAQRSVDGTVGTGYYNFPNITMNYSAVTGACLMTRRELYERLGGLNERDLPVNFNDVEFCLRLRRENYLVVYTPHALLKHRESATRLPEVDAAGQSYMLSHWGGELLSDPYYSPHFDLTTADYVIDVAKPDSLRTLQRQRVQDAVVGQLGGGQLIGQGFTAREDQLAAIGVQFGTHGGHCTGTIRLHLRETISSDDDIATAEINAAYLLDNHFLVFTFVPIENSGGRSFYFFLEYEEGDNGEALTIWRSRVTDPLCGPYYHNHQPQQGTLSFATYRFEHIQRHTLLNLQDQHAPPA